MTRVRMVADRTGGRYDGQDWPPPGGEFDVPGTEAEALLAQGDAVTADQPEPEAAAEAPETPQDAPEPPVVTQPAVNDPKGAWVDHAVAQGAPQEVAESLTKQQLIDQYGNP